VCQFVVGEEDVLDGSVGVENVGVDMTPDLEREGAEELAVGLCVWRMADGGWGLVSVGVRVRRRLVNRG
jgi:hypothetical protein